MHMARTPFGVFQVSDSLAPGHATLMFSFIDLHSLSAMAWMRSTIENTWNKSEFLDESCAPNFGARIPPTGFETAIRNARHFNQMDMG